MKAKRLGLIVIMLVLAGCIMPTMAVAVPPIPSDVQMVAPDPSLPKELADFWGKWQGRTVWGNRGFDFFIIVEKIGEKNANLYFWSTGTGKWERIEADVIKDGSEYKIRFRVLISSVEKVRELSLRKDGKMELYFTDTAISGYNTFILGRVP